MNRLINDRLSTYFIIFFTLVLLLINSCHQISSKFLICVCFEYITVIQRFKDDLKFPSTTELSL